MTELSLIMRETVLMDADKGIIIVNPQKDGMPQMSERIRKMNAVRLRQRKLKATNKPPVPGAEKPGRCGRSSRCAPARPDGRSSRR